MHRPSKRRTLLTIVGTALAAALVASVATAAFATIFPDVNRFEAEIDAFTDAGCASGEGGKFLPNDPIEREAVAVWINRCAGRVAHTAVDNGAQGGPDPVNDNETLATVDITVDAAGGGTQFVLLLASTSIFTNSDFATYNTSTVSNISIEIWDDDAGTRVGGSGTGLTRFTDNDDGSAFAANVVVPAGNGDHTFSVRLNTSGIAPDSLFGRQTEITALVVPFGHAGGNVLSAATLAPATKSDVTRAQDEGR